MRALVLGGGSYFARTEADFEVQVFNNSRSLESQYTSLNHPSRRVVIAGEGAFHTLLLLAEPGGPPHRTGPFLWILVHQYRFYCQRSGGCQNRGKYHTVVADGLSPTGPRMIAYEEVDEVGPSEARLVGNIRGENSQGSQSGGRTGSTLVRAPVYTLPRFRSYTTLAIVIVVAGFVLLLLRCVDSKTAPSVAFS